MGGVHLPPEGIMMWETLRGVASRGLPSLARSKISQGAFPPMTRFVGGTPIIIGGASPGAMVRSTHLEGAAITICQRCQMPACEQSESGCFQSPTSHPKIWRARLPLGGACRHFAPHIQL
jgi:hypothetical protein